MRRIHFFLVGIAILAASLSRGILVRAATNDPEVDAQATAVATNLQLFGMQPMDITTDPTDGNYVYAASYTPNGIFHSSDGGETWQGLPSGVDYGAGRHIAVDETNGDVYAMVGDNVIKSTDHGTTWSVLTANLEGHPIMGSMSLMTNGIYIVGVDNGQVQVSSDGGASFTVVTLGTTGMSQSIVSLAAGSAGTVYAILQHESEETSTLYRSLDNGLTWTNMAVENAGMPAGSRYYGVSVDPANSNHVVLASYHPSYDSYHSLNGGASWTVLEQSNGNQIGANEGVFDGAGRLYIGVNYTDDPQSVVPTWESITMATPLSSVRGDIYAVDNTNPQTIFTNTGLGIAKSEDGGVSWVDRVDGLTAVQTFAISQTDDKDVVWLGANGGLARTTNFTADVPEWDYPILPETGLSSVKAVWVKPTDADIVVAGVTDHISRSTDGGTTWNQADAPAFVGTVENLIQSPRDQDTLYAAYTNTSLIEDSYNGGVLKSVNGGVTWTELDFPTTLASSALAVGVQDDADVLYAGIGSGGSETGVYKFVNDTWTKLDETFGGFYVNNILVHPEDNDIVFVSLEADSTVGSLYKSTDGGMTWTVIENGLEGTSHLGAMTAQTGDTTTLYLAGQAFDGEGMIYKSTDGGDSWSEYYAGLQQEFFYALLFDGLLAGNDRGAFDLKSLGKIVLKANKHGERYTLNLSLKDAATKLALEERRVTIYQRKPGKTWKILRLAKTNDNGAVTLNTTARKNTKFKVVWKPSKNDRAEYTRSTSNIVKIGK